MKNQRNPLMLLFVVWIALLLLLALTVASSFVPMGAGNTVANAAIAAAKAGLVVAIYMQMRCAIALIRVVALVAVVTLGILFLLSGLDYATRLVNDAPWQSTPPSLYME